MTKKRIFALSMVLLLILSSTVLAYAEVQPRDTATVVFTTNRISRTTAQATVDVNFSSEVNRYTIAIYLQKKVNGVWINDTSNEDYAFYDSGTDSYDYIVSLIYSDLTSGEIYRLKCVSRDYIGSSSYEFTGYSNQF